MSKIFCFLFIVINLSCFVIANDKIYSKKSASELVQEAILIQKKSYSPYSKYPVGAVIQTTDGKIFRGTNIENASYGLTICAERSAVFSAICQGVKNFESITIVTKDGGAPCGCCRQVLNEFNPDILIIIANEKGLIKKQYKLSDLLPKAFGPSNVLE